MKDAKKKIARLSELKDGRMKEIKAGKATLLVAKVDGQVYVLGGKCPHYGAPLAKGTLCRGRIICPWHQSVFDLKTGDMLEPPSLDGIQRFEVSIKGKHVCAILPKDASSSRTTPMYPPAPSRDQRTFVVLGAGAAGAAAVETLRQEGFQGRIIMISSEDRVPYDRPSCSKSYLSGEIKAKEMPLRAKTFYEKHKIERVTGQVIQCDVIERVIRFADRDPITADMMLIATGGTPVPLNVPGASLKNVLLLRSWGDSRAILGAARKARKAVVIGSSFIGMEVAASLAKHDVSVTVVAPNKVPFEKALGKEVGAAIQKLHEKKGTKFKMGRKVTRLTGKSKVKSVELDDGSSLDADLVVVGIGVRPATAFIKGAKLNDDGSLSVDEHLRVTDGVYAAGDIAQFPNVYTGEPVRIEHWRLAQQHGCVAARNMAGHAEKFTGVPFFWTRHFDTSISYVGHATAWDEVIVRGNLKKLDFTAFYSKNDRLLAAVGTQSDQLGAFGELMRTGRLPAASELRNRKSFPLSKLLKGAS